MNEINKPLPNIFNNTAFDAIVQIVFRDVQDYINVKDDPYFRDVVNPDRFNFADDAESKMVFGWFERHVADGKIVRERERL